MSRLVSFSAFASVGRVLSRSDCQRRSAMSSSTRQRLRRSLWSRYSLHGYVLCCWCRCPLKKTSWTLDHLQALCFGGRNTIDNLRPACLGCNQRRAKEQGRIRREIETEWMVEELRMRPRRWWPPT